MKHINIDQLYYFKQIAQRKNMTAAANELYVAQSALSFALANLEKNLGVKVFEREKGRLVLNEYGKILLHYTDIILENYDQALAEIQTRKEQDDRTIRVGVVNEYFSRKAILSFSNAYPDIDIVQSIVPPQVLQSEQLLHSNYDFVFGTLPFCNRGLLYDIIAEEELYLLVPQSHPLAVKASAPLSALNGENLIIHGSGYSFHEFVVRLLEDEDIHPQSVKECVGSVIHEMVIKGDGVTIVINSMRSAQSIDGRLCKLPLETHVKRQKVLIYPEKSVHSSIKRTFRDYMIEFFHQNGPHVES